MSQEDKLGTLEEAIEFDRKRNYQYTAPVAWEVVEMNFATLSPLCAEGWEKKGFTVIPLYTAPRELSMEEIEDCFPDNGCNGTINGKLEVSAQFLHDFANEIIKKASEK